MDGKPPVRITRRTQSSIKRMGKRTQGVRAAWVLLRRTFAEEIGGIKKGTREVMGQPFWTNLAATRRLSEGSSRSGFDEIVKKVMRQTRLTVLGRVIVGSENIALLPEKNLEKCRSPFLSGLWLTTVVLCP